MPGCIYNSSAEPSAGNYRDSDQLQLTLAFRLLASMNRKSHRNDAVDFLSVVMKPSDHNALAIPRSAGFTLVELITSIVIIGILAAVVGPRMFDNTSVSTRGYIDEVASALRYANSIAVSSGCATAVTLTTTDYKVSQHPAAGNTCALGGAWSTPVQRIDGLGTVTGNSPSGITLSPATQIVFDGRGAVISGAPPTLTSGTHTIKIDVVSGMVTVQ